MPTEFGEFVAHGYRSSYTVPLYQSGTLLGFLFFDSRKPGAFDGRLPDELQIYVQLCRLSVLNVFSLSHAVEGRRCDMIWRGHIQAELTHGQAQLIGSVGREKLGNLAVESRFRALDHNQSACARALGHEFKIVCLFA